MYTSGMNDTHLILMLKVPLLRLSGLLSCNPGLRDSLAAAEEDSAANWDRWDSSLGMVASFIAA